jgi:hypothetical protein
VPAAVPVAEVAVVVTTSAENAIVGASINDPITVAIAKFLIARIKHLLSSIKYNSNTTR